VAGRFVEGRVRAGVRGIVLAGLAGAALSAVAFGLIAMTTLVVIDLHRRFGWAERWLARRTGKAPVELDQADELQLARPVVLLLGAAVTLAALLLTGIDNLPAFLLAWLGVFAGPMLALFLLGLFTRRATGLAGRFALLVGMAAGACAALGPMLAELSGMAALWPLPVLGAGGPMIVGTGVALLAGYVLSFALGKRMSRRELAGLVVGAGPLGVLREAEEPLAGLSALEAEARRPPRRPSPWR
jgi:SSS family solute:Na+ symporter